MLTRFHVKNFLCLKDVDVDLGPLNIFIGPNSSGKSALFKALGTVSRLLRYPLRGDASGDFNVEPGITFDDAVWCGDTQLPIIFELWFDNNEDDTPDYYLELRRGYPGWSVVSEKFMFGGRRIDTGVEGFKMPTLNGEPRILSGPFRATLAFLTYHGLTNPKIAPYLEPIRKIREQVGQARRYRPSPSDISQFVKPMVVKGITRNTTVDENGRGFAIELQNTWKADRPTFDTIQKELCKLHPHITALDFQVDWRGTGILYKTNRVAFGTPASLESDGVLLTTFLLWRLYTSPINFKLCLEEPENGVHVASLGQRYQSLKHSLESFGNSKGVQILVSTHSRDLLNAIDSRPNILSEVRVVEFAPDTGTKIYNLNHWRQIDQLLDETRNQIGDLWWSNRLASHT